MMDIQKLISLVHARPSLWNRYNNKGDVRQDWDEVAYEMNVSAELCRAKWINLRNVYFRELKKCKSRLSDGQTNPTSIRWNYFKHMSFLDDQIMTPESSTRLGDEHESQESFDSYYIKDEFRDDLNALPLLNPAALTTVEGSLIDPMPNNCEAFHNQQNNTWRRKFDVSIFRRVNVDRNDLERVSNIERNNFIRNNLETNNVERGIVERTNPERNIFDRTNFQPNNSGRNIEKRRLSNPSEDAKKIKLVDATTETDVTKEDTRSSNNDLKKTKVVDVTENIDSDYHFLMSLLPYLQAVPQHRKMIVRTKIQTIFCEEQSLQSKNS